MPGQKALSLGGAMPLKRSMRKHLRAEFGGFSLQIAVRVDAQGRKRLEQLCRTITRPALCDERVQRKATGQAEPKLKTRGATAPPT